MKKFLILVFLITTAWARSHTYSLTAHVLSVESVNGRHVSTVSNLSTGEITGSTWGGLNYNRVELQVGNIIYITHTYADVETGQDIQIGFHDKDIEASLPDKHGHLKNRLFVVHGTKEKAPGL